MMTHPKADLFNQDQVLHLPVPPLEHLFPDVNIIASEKCEFAQNQILLYKSLHNDIV